MTSSEYIDRQRERDMQQRVWGFDAARWLEAEAELRAWAERHRYRITHFSVQASPEPDAAERPRGYPAIIIELMQS